jgi:hypothetical protein
VIKSKFWPMDDTIRNKIAKELKDIGVDVQK